MRAVELLQSLVAFDSTSRNSNLDLVEWVCEVADAPGVRFRRTYDHTGEKANLLVSFGPDVPGGIVFSAHTDVVPVDGQEWTGDPFELTRRDGRLVGRGTTDMKGFIAACLATVPRWVTAHLRRPVHLALSHDEESGCLGVPALVEDLVTNVPLPAVAIVGEPTSMQVVDRHRGYLGFRTTFPGQAAHSSDPSRGVNAIGAAARFVAALNELGAGGTTVSVGLIDGGTGINVVPSRCELSWEIRPAADADIGSLRAAAHRLLDRSPLPDLMPHTREIISIPPLRPDPDSPAITIARRFGAHPPASDVPFGTEAGYFQARGIPTVVCGPGSIEQAHRADEWIAVDQLAQACAFLDRLTCWAEA